MGQHRARDCTPAAWPPRRQRCTSWGSPPSGSRAGFAAPTTRCSDYAAARADPAATARPPALGHPPRCRR
eukprot:881851-Rhodomonas_salina.1